MSLDEVRCPIKPDSLLFENALLTRVDAPDVNFDREGGIISGYVGYTSEIGMNCDLRRFPFDRHMIMLKIPTRSFGVPLIFKNHPEPSFTGLLGGLSDKWKMLPPRLMIQSSQDDIEDSGIDPYVMYLTPVQRLPGNC
jgi:hypothetical protein